MTPSTHHRISASLVVHCRLLHFFLLVLRISVSTTALCCAAHSHSHQSAQLLFAALRTPTLTSQHNLKPLPHNLKRSFSWFHACPMHRTAARSHSVCNTRYALFNGAQPPSSRPLAANGKPTASWITETAWAAVRPAGCTPTPGRCVVDPMLRAVDMTWYDGLLQLS